MKFQLLMKIWDSVYILSKFIKYDLFVTVSILTDRNGGEKGPCF